MKKEYNQPSIMVVHLKPCRLMINSGEKQEVYDLDYNSNTQTIGAKGGFGGWDDDFEEDF